MYKYLIAAVIVAFGAYFANQARNSKSRKFEKHWQDAKDVVS